MADQLGDILSRSVFTAGKMFAPPLLDESGQPSGDDVAITASTSSGTLGWNCADSANVSGGYVASTSRWTDNVTSTCFASSPLYCFGIGHVTPFVPAPATGRRAFQTSTLGLSTLSEMDARCNAAATVAGYAGSFKAWLATTTASASSRFSPDGLTWVRPDGIALAPTAADVLEGRLTAPLNVGPDLSYTSGKAYTGAPSPILVGTGATTCNDWTGSGTVQTGDAHFVGGSAFSAGVYDCNTSGVVYCLQE